jgi:hypothetical protein
LGGRPALADRATAVKKAQEASAHLFQQGFD